MKKNYNQAKEYYETILLKTSSFYKAYLHLGIIHSHVEDLKDTIAARRELEEARRYEENAEVL